MKSRNNWCNSSTESKLFHECIYHDLETKMYFIFSFERISQRDVKRIEGKVGSQINGLVVGQGTGSQALLIF